ncbi:MAG: hypothetical protein K2P78_05395 [Gemmataceae bacterium]|nr:hypothetical protein [Gemmataceae bacterium]
MFARALVAALGLAAVAALTPAADPAAGPAAAETFRGYTSKPGRYKVKLPSRADLTESITVPDEGAKMFNLFAVVGSPKAVYGIMYFDLAKKPSNPKQTIKEVGDGTRGKGKTTGTQDLDLGEDVVAREWSVELPNAAFRYRVILKDRRVWHVALMAEDEEVTTNKDAEKFFDSFEILDEEVPKTTKPKPKADDDDEPAPKPKPKPKPKVDDEDEPLPKPKKPTPKPVDDEDEPLPKPKPKPAPKKDDNPA